MNRAMMIAAVAAVIAAVANSQELLTVDDGKTDGDCPHVISDCGKFAARISQWVVA